MNKLRQLVKQQPTHTTYTMKKKEKENTTWKRLKAWTKDEVQEYLFANRIDDPREQATVRSGRAVLGGGERHTET